MHRILHYVWTRTTGREFVNSQINIIDVQFVGLVAASSQFQEARCRLCVAATTVPARAGTYTSNNATKCSIAILKHTPHLRAFTLLLYLLAMELLFFHSTCKYADVQFVGASTPVGPVRSRRTHGLRMVESQKEGGMQ